MADPAGRYRALHAALGRGLQRFNGTLGSFVHVHVVVPDGVFTRAGDAGVTFHEERAPSREEIAAFDVADRTGTDRAS